MCAPRPNLETVKQVILSEKSIGRAREGAWAYSSPGSGTAEASPALEALSRMVIEIGRRQCRAVTGAHDNESVSPAYPCHGPTPARCRRPAGRAVLSEAVPEYPGSIVEAAKGPSLLAREDRPATPAIASAS